MLVRWTPFNEMSRLQSDLNRLFDSFDPRPWVSSAVTASLAAIVLTVLAVVAVNAHAGNRTLTPSVTIQVPTVEIEVLDADTAHPATIADRVNG